MTGSTDENRQRYLLIALTIAAAVLYLPTVWNGYTFDDVPVVQANRIVGELDYVAAVVEPYWPPREESTGGQSNWRPLATLSFLLDRQLLGLVPPAHHLVNAALYGLLVLLVFPLARRLTGGGWTALAACALFAVHPAHTEAVAPVVGRSDLLAAIGALWALECFLRYRDGGGWRWLAWGALAYALGLGGKESAAPLLLLLPLADWLLRGQSLASLARRSALAYLPFVAVAALYLAARFAVLGEASFQHARAVDYTVSERLVFAARNAVVSTGLLFVPTRFHHMITTLPASAPYTYADPRGLVVFAYTIGGAIIGLGWLVLLRRAPRAAFLWLAALLCWLPTSGLFPAAAGASMRFLLLPSAFLAVGAGAVLATAVRTRPSLKALLQGAVAVLLVAGACMTVWRSMQWRNHGTFFGAVVAAEPRAHSAWYSLGTWYATQNPPDLVNARQSFQRALDILDMERSYVPRMNLAVSYEIGTSGERYGPGSDLNEAERRYRELLELFPQRSKPALNLAVLLERRGRNTEALEAYERTLQIDPAQTEAPQILMKCAQQRQQMGQPDRAIQLYRQLLEQYPDHPLRAQAARQLRRLTNG